MSNCREGRDSCDYSLLNPSEARDITRAERVRNYAACLNRRGYCDRSRLTPSEAAKIPPEVGEDSLIHMDPGVLVIDPYGRSKP
jgi:hypothetical protein